jgi:hypothetical protein
MSLVAIVVGGAVTVAGRVGVSTAGPDLH